MIVDQPKMLGDSAATHARLAMLHEPHMLQLTAFVKRLRSQRGDKAAIPNFDPWDGGVRAECMFLLEAPGRRAVGSCFVSRNNPDETAKNFFLLNAEAGINRRQTITWNVVPWYVGSQSKIRAVNRSDIEEASRYLAKLLTLLPRLRVVVLVGRKAQRAEETLKRLKRDLDILRCPHPSPLCLNGRPERRHEILDCFRSAATYLSPSATRRFR